MKLKFGLFFIVAISLMFAGCMSWEMVDPEVLAEPISYVVELPELEKSEIHKRSTLWIANTYSSAESVITFQDEEAGSLKGSGRGRVSPAGDMFPREFRYNLSIDSKDGKVRLQFSNVTASTYYAGTTSVAGIVMKYKAHYDAVLEYFNGLATDFETSFTAEVEDW